MKRLGSEHIIHEMGPENLPAIEINIGETLIVETLDCYGGRVNSSPESYEYASHPKRNPATGPIFIRGVKPGDILVVSIKNIQIDNRGLMVLRPGIGILGDKIKTMRVKEILIQDKHAILNNRHLPLRPMIGVIGVALKSEKISTRIPGSHGGNMDTSDISEGVEVLLPVQVPGALLAIGDVHAAMGDGEVSGTGIEIRAEVTIQVGIVPDSIQLCPMVRTTDNVISIASDNNLATAIKMAVDDMVRTVMQTGLSFEEAYMIVGACGDLRVSQLVNPQVTVRMVVPRAVFEGRF